MLERVNFIRYLECPVCHGNVDPGEIVGGICIDCAKKETKERDRKHRVKLMLISTDFHQMELKVV